MTYTSYGLTDFIPFGLCLYLLVVVIKWILSMILSYDQLANDQWRICFNDKGYPLGVSVLIHCFFFHFA